MNDTKDTQDELGGGLEFDKLVESVTAPAPDSAPAPPADAAAVPSAAPAKKARKPRAQKAEPAADPAVDPTTEPLFDVHAKLSPQTQAEMARGRRAIGL